jgi:hypothetical protein
LKMMSCITYGKITKTVEFHGVGFGRYLYSHGG